MADLADFDTPPIVLMEDAGFVLIEDWQPGWYIDGAVSSGNLLIHPGMDGGFNLPGYSGGFNG